MTSGWKVACFAVALVCFVVAAVLQVARRGGQWPACLLTVGLAFWGLVFLWDAVALDP